jgi:hypothetical protein
MTNYSEIAGRILFGSDRLDNAMRGNFIEAVIYDALVKAMFPNAKLEKTWYFLGLGWGPWDFQRGDARSGTRVRFQVKVKASQQIWQSPENTRSEFVLGWRQMQRLPKYFDRDFPKDKFGECELSGYRCDFMLLGWHGPRPGQSVGALQTQADPHNYDYFVVPCSELGRDRSCALKSIKIEDLYNNWAPTSFSDLPATMNAKADALPRNFGEAHPTDQSRRTRYRSILKSPTRPPACGRGSRSPSRPNAGNPAL